MSGSKRLIIGCIVGTRPEIIKMAPIIFRLQECSWIQVFLINTAQHRNLLDNMFDLFNLHPDVDLNCMRIDQSLGELTGTLCKKLDDLMNNQHLDALLAVGDTTTVFVSSLIAFYHHIPFGHIEAGLRSFNSQEPFPEEINRELTSQLTTWHFAPTNVEKDNLIHDGVAASKIMVTGNPVIDALYWVLGHTSDNLCLPDLEHIIVVTAHRRENFGRPLQNICLAIIELSERFKHINFVIPVHPNPNVQKKIELLLSNREGIFLIPPLRYDEFAHLMNRSLLVLTDSGGIQEEAPALNKPILILRNTTERPAIITEGIGLLIGTEQSNIVDKVSQLITNKKLYSQMAKGISPYGDGHAAERIVESLKKSLLGGTLGEHA